MSLNLSKCSGHLALVLFFIALPLAIDAKQVALAVPQDYIAVYDILDKGEIRELASIADKQIKKAARSIPNGMNIWQLRIYMMI